MIDWGLSGKVKHIVSRRRFPFKFVYSDDYWMVDLGQHVFPIKKYRLIYERLLQMGADRGHFIQPQPASEKSLALGHTQKYIRKLMSGKLSQAELRTLELPFSQEGLKFALQTVGGTIQASLNALEEKSICVHIGGGFHHAYADHGEGFCVLNDVAVALIEMVMQHNIRKAMVVDCDVHQGNGTAAILSDKEYAFTFSLHQMDIYPADKPSSTLDVGLWSGDGDKEYLRKLQENIPKIYDEFQPNLIYYLAGADPYVKDQLGGLELTKDGLINRDQLVIEHARSRGIPMVIVLAGGYAFDIEEVADIHINTIKTARKIERRLWFSQKIPHPLSARKNEP
jgi:acetoin utilization deacetylase AcuC-like enzyme